jgi:hypothetical protein
VKRVVRSLSSIISTSYQNLFRPYRGFDCLLLLHSHGSRRGL